MRHQGFNSALKTLSNGHQVPILLFHAIEDALWHLYTKRGPRPFLALYEHCVDSGKRIGYPLSAEIAWFGLCDASEGTVPQDIQNIVLARTMTHDECVKIPRVVYKRVIRALKDAYHENTHCDGSWPGQKAIRELWDLLECGFNPNLSEEATIILQKHGLIDNDKWPHPWVITVVKPLLPVKDGNPLNIP